MDAILNFRFNRLASIKWQPEPFFSASADALLGTAQSSPILALPIVAFVLSICLLATQTNISRFTVLAAHEAAFIIVCFCTQIPAALAFFILVQSMVFFVVVREVPNMFGFFRLRWLLRIVVQVIIGAAAFFVLLAVARE
jgi:hypothetical protein